jgi:plastocyanin
MRQIVKLLLPLLFLGTAILIPISCGDNSTSNTEPNTVVMSGTSFSPSTLTVSKGTTVTFKNTDGTKHTATSDVGSWDIGDVVGGSSKTFVFATTGTFPYHCIYHASMGMKGTIVVQ